MTYVSHNNNFTTHAVEVPPLFDRLLIQTQLGKEFGTHLRSINNSYLFLGPEGAGKLEWAIAFAAAIMCPENGCGTCATCVAVLQTQHRDLNLIDNKSGIMLIDVARDAVKLARLTPNSARYRVILITEFENSRDVAPVLLKTIEEPPVSTVFIILARSLTQEFLTIASRCIQTEFFPVRQGEVRDYLVDLGVTHLDAELGASLSGGNLIKAKALTLDGRISERYDLWRGLVDVKFVSGSQIMARVARVVVFLDSVTSHLRTEHQAVLQATKDGLKGRSGAKGVLKELESEHKRLLRYRRLKEIELGLGLYLSSFKEFGLGSVTELSAYVQRCDLVQHSIFQLQSGVSEQLALSSLLAKFG